MNRKLSISAIKTPQEVIRWIDNSNNRYTYFLL